ncbi:MAG TPA: NAD(P)H-hydrate dehydratase [Myxococcales bacterium]|jgi:NAD(P)H-hydrate epimerase
MRLLTAREQRELDELAAQAGLPTRVLMESAGAAVARAALSFKPRRAMVYCGPGNNGGDGAVAARFLREAGIETYLWYTRPPRGGPAESAAQAFGAERLRAATGDGDVVIDAIFGSGLSRPPEGSEAEAIRAMDLGRERGARIVAVDVPSGIDADTGALYPVHLAQADVTVTLHAPKRGLYLHPAAECAGRIEVAPIGIPRALEDRLSTPACELLDEAWALRQLPRRPRNAHKNDFGHALVVAGSPGKSGAAAMVCEAALRAGAGLVTLAARADVQAALAAVPEAMFVPLPGEGPLSLRDLPALREALKGKSALAVGPGIARGPETGPLLGELLAGLDPSCSAVLDADALNALADHRERIAGWLSQTRSRVLLTPHPGEFARLTGEDTEKTLADRIDAAARAAQRFSACIVLKGAHSVVADPEGTSAICGAGNPGMATAGSGDILTGICAALLARRGGIGGVGDRARLAVYLHARAGDLAAATMGETPLIATDIVRVGLPRLFRRLQR